MTQECPPLSEFWKALMDNASSLSGGDAYQCAQG